MAKNQSTGLFEVQVDPDKEFALFIRDSIEKVGDLTIPFELITMSWFKSNRAIFALRGPGKYQDLSPNYKPQKLKAVGFLYPILKRTGRLEKSLTQPDSPDAVSLILNRKVLILGTKVPYGPPHQDGAPKRKLPKRPFILLGPEQTAPEEINVRREAWINMIESYVVQVMEQRQRSGAV